MEIRILLALTACRLADCVFATVTTIDENTALQNVLSELESLQFSYRFLEKRTYALEKEREINEIRINDLRKSNKLNMANIIELVNLNYKSDKRVENLTKLVIEQGEKMVLAEKRQSYLMNEMKNCDGNYKKKSSAAGGKLNETVTTVVQMKDSDQLLPTYLRSINRESVSTVNKRLTPPESRQHIAFSAQLSQNPTGLGTMQTIPFDIVTLNEGHAFDSVLHTFICPVKGIYVFQSAILSQPGDVVNTEIVKDGTVLVRMLANGPDNDHDQGFNSAITDCYKGEKIWVRIRHVYGSSVYSDHYSSFSGYMLWDTV